jgi:hypothetical protein
MKKVYVKNVDELVTAPVYNGIGKEFMAQGTRLEVSDGYHTFDELYDHRVTLYVALCRNLKWTESLQGPDEAQVRPYDIWRSKLHADGSAYEGWFIMGIGKDAGKQISYHLPEKMWEATDFAETLDRAPEFDGHSSENVLERLSQL